MTTHHKKWACAALIFLSTLFICGFFVKKLWYREDDLGQIINGLMYRSEDIKRVFTADEREFLTPSNYKRSKANVISGFYRPIKHVFFTIIYSLFGLEPKAYFWFHVGVHALNAALLFWIFALWWSLWGAFLGGMMFAFYPDMSWLTWAATLHNSLATLFLLLSFLCFYASWHTPSRFCSYSWYFLSALTFLLSIFSRENGVFYPFWMFVGVFLLFRQYNKPFGASLWLSIRKTWIFFAVNMMYVLVRLWAYGMETLDRTYHNLFLRFPFLVKWFSSAAHVQSAEDPLQTVSSAVGGVGDGIVHTSSLVPHFFSRLSKSFVKWTSSLFMVDGETSWGIMLIVLFSFFMVIFLYYAYRASWRLFLFFMVGFWCFAWPGVVAYPSPRYINSAYPLLIAVLVVGIAHLLAERKVLQRFFGYAMTLLCIGAVVKGGYCNAWSIRGAGESTMQMRNERYAPFFAMNTLAHDSHFILIGSPFVSDIENIFQYFLHDLHVTLVHEPFTTFAERGSFGCTLDYRIKGVPSTITPIEGGFRITSQDPAHCGLWLRFSDKPIVWSERDKAYRWTSQDYQPDRWYRCSLGKFMIHAMVNHELVSDMSVVIDRKWLSNKTVFVSWDTILGRYYILPSEHILKSLQ